MRWCCFTLELKVGCYDTLKCAKNCKIFINAIVEKDNSALAWLKNQIGKLHITSHTLFVYICHCYILLAGYIIWFVTRNLTISIWLIEVEVFIVCSSVDSNSIRSNKAMAIPRKLPLSLSKLRLVQLLAPGNLIVLCWHIGNMKELCWHATNKGGLKLSYSSYPRIRPLAYMEMVSLAVY
jgi:hypothetical protein